MLRKTLKLSAILAALSLVSCASAANSVGQTMNRLNQSVARTITG